MELLLSSKSLHAVAISASVERQSHHYFWLLASWQGRTHNGVSTVLIKSHISRPSSSLLPLLQRQDAAATLSSTKGDDVDVQFAVIVGVKALIMGPRRSSSSSSAHQATPQRRNERRSTLTTDALYGLGIAIILFAAGTIVWSTRHLNRITNVSTSSISNSKAEFLGGDQFAKNDKLELQKEEPVLSLDDIPLPDSGDGAIIPLDLSVNFLQRIIKAPGAPPEPSMVAHASKARVEEDFLPV
eukprot:scaffold15788_cov78-Skeletonema_dohrnii-CCMP3373.AAC.2